MSPRRIIRYRSWARRTFFTFVRGNARYRNVVSQDLRGQVWNQLIDIMPETFDMPLAALYWLQGDLEKDPSWPFFCDVFGKDLRQGAKAYLAQFDDQCLEFLATHEPCSQLADYLAHLEKVVTDTLQLRDLRTGQAPWWALLALHEDVTGIDLVNPFWERQPKAAGISVRCNIHVHFGGARLVCYDQSTYEHWRKIELNENPVIVFDRTLGPAGEDEPFRNWGALQSMLNEGMAEVLGKGKQTLENSFHALGMPRNPAGYPIGRRKAGEPHDQAKGRAGHERQRDNDEQRIATIVEWILANKPERNPNRRSLLRDIMTDQLGVAVPWARQKGDKDLAKTRPKKRRRFRLKGTNVADMLNVETS